jgi:uncharacterized metal-binding protein
MLLKDNDTQLNIIIGLCIGHNILLTCHSAAPVTTLMAKDRVPANNPADAIYSGYYLRKRFGITEQMSAWTELRRGDCVVTLSRI